MWQQELDLRHQN